MELKKAKECFPYEYLKRFNQLNKKKLPQCILQQSPTNISEEDYQFCIVIFAETEHDLN